MHKLKPYDTIKQTGKLEFMKEDKTVNKEWKRLYEEAMSVLNPRDVSNKMWVGSVASAVLTKKGNFIRVYALIRTAL